jgi:hypothetical protein
MTPPGDLHPPRQLAATLSLLLLLALVLADVLFIAVHVLHIWSPWLKSWMFSIEQDRGLAEIFQYLKQFVLAACLLVAFVRTRGWAFAGWGVFFGFLLLDDVLEIHEQIGRVLGSQLGIPTVFGLRTDDYGEIAYSVLVGLGVVAFVMLIFRRGGDVSRRVSADLLCLLGVLALFAVFFDTVHTIAYYRAPALAQMLALLEDGGEMLVMSLITTYAFDSLMSSGRSRIAVWSWVRGRLPVNATMK